MSEMTTWQYIGIFASIVFTIAMFVIRTLLLRKQARLQRELENQRKSKDRIKIKVYGDEEWQEWQYKADCFGGIILVRGNGKIVEVLNRDSTASAWRRYYGEDKKRRDNRCQ